ncbi:MAG: cell wall hydrolase [Alphaproteobacteria bacterium]
MINKVANIRGGQWDRRYLRVAIWAGLLAYTVYLSGAAWAGPLETKAGHVGRWAAQAVTTGKTVAAGVRGGGLVPGLFASKEERLIFQRPTLGDPRDEISCLALNIYHEARGEPDEGKLAVGHVVMNRVLSSRFPSTVCDVVRQGGEVRRYRCQFSWWCDGRSDKPRNKKDWQSSSEFALAIYWSQTEDPTDGALWYHADYVSPNWRKDFVQGPKIGRHIFYQQRPAQYYEVATSFSVN